MGKTTAHIYFQHKVHFQHLGQNIGKLTNIQHLRKVLLQGQELANLNFETISDLSTYNVTTVHMFLFDFVTK